MKNNTKIFGTLLFVLLATTAVQAQEGFGTNTPNKDAVIDLSASNKGLLLPRIALTSTTTFAPLTAHVAGMAVYNTATTGDVTPGYYYNDGTQWVRTFGHAATGAPTITNAAAGDVYVNTTNGDLYTYNGTAWVLQTGTGTEPWYNQATSTAATANTQNIYQSGTVAINKTTPLSGAILDVQGAVRGGINTTGVVGSNSAAFGKNNIVSGGTSFGVGEDNTVSGLASAALGSGNAVSSNKSFALGTSNVASIGADNTALFGDSNTATGDRSLVVGAGNTLTDMSRSLIVGGSNSLTGPTTSQGVIIAGRNNTVGATSLGTDTNAVFGLANTVGTTGLSSGDVVTGSTNTVQSTSSAIVAGNNNAVSTSNSSIVAGSSNTIAAKTSIAGGRTNTMTSAAESSMVIGEGNTVSGLYSFAGGVTAGVGLGNQATGQATFAFGMGNKASGTQATVIGGRGNTASGNYSFVGGGRNTTAYSDYETAFGFNTPTYTPTATLTDKLFNVAYNTDKFTILKNGNTGVGTITPTDLLDVNGTARVRTLGASAGTDVLVVADATTGQLHKSTVTTAAIVASDLTNDAWINTPASTRVELGATSTGAARTAGTEFVAKDNGNVGIGTTNPLQKLHITGGNLRIDGAQSDATTGVIYRNGNPFIHSYGLDFPGTSNLFVGLGTGNFSLIPANAKGNTGIGNQSLSALTTGSENTGVGTGTMSPTTTGSKNTGIGYVALIGITTGFENTAVGARALQKLIDGNRNTALGNFSLNNVTTGNDNVGLGDHAGSITAVGTPFITTGSGNTMIGSLTNFETTAQFNRATAIGFQAAVNQDDSLVLGAIAGVNGATVSTKVGIGTTAPSTKLHIKDGHIRSEQSTAPTVSLFTIVGPIAGPGSVPTGTAVVLPGSTDTKGRIEITCTAIEIWASTLRLTYNTPYATPPTVIVSVEQSSAVDAPIASTTANTNTYFNGYIEGVDQYAGGANEKIILHYMVIE